MTPRPRIALASRAPVRRRALVQLLPLMWVATACAGEDGALQTARPPSSEGELTSSAELELGSGEASFEPARAGEHLRLYAGTQGGHHIWLSVRVRGFESEQVRMILDVVPAEPAPPARTDVKLHFTPVADDEGLREFVGFPARVLEPACAAGKPVRLSVQLEDGDGQHVAGELEVVADAPPLGFASECGP